MRNNQSKFFVVTVKYKEAVPDTDKYKNKSQKLLVNAMTCTESEARVIKWKPSNWIDAVIWATNPSPISEVAKHPTDLSETWWKIELAYQDDNGKSSKHFVTANGGMPEEVIKRIIRMNPLSSFEGINKHKVLMDDDLLAEG